MAAEIFPPRLDLYQPRLASMRPRRMAAEIGGKSRCDGAWTTRLQ